MSHKVQGTVPTVGLAWAMYGDDWPLALSSPTKTYVRQRTVFRVYHRVDWFHQPVCLLGLERGYYFSLAEGDIEVKRWVRSDPIPLPIHVLALITGEGAWLL